MSKTFVKRSPDLFARKLRDVFARKSYVEVVQMAVASEKLTDVKLKNSTAVTAKFVTQTDAGLKLNANLNPLHENVE